MKITMIYIKPEKGMTAISLPDSEMNKEKFDQIDDLNVRHLIVENKYFRKSKYTGELPITCAFHIDHCLNDLVDTFGKETFVNKLGE